MKKTKRTTAQGAMMRTMGELKHAGIAEARLLELVHSGLTAERERLDTRAEHIRAQLNGKRR